MIALTVSYDALAFADWNDVSIELNRRYLSLTAISFPAHWVRKAVGAVAISGIIFPPCFYFSVDREENVPIGIEL